MSVPEQADLVIAGDIVTMNPAQPRADAIAVSRGRVVTTGARADAVAACAPGTPILPLPGTIVPGFIDSHVHMLWAGRDIERLDVSDSKTIPELLDSVRTFAEANPDEPWLMGFAALDPHNLAEGHLPSADELEHATGGRPLYLDRNSHDAIVNRAALVAAGITDETADPPGGVIERADSGRATGLLIERPAAELVERVTPRPTLDDRLRWLARIQPTYLAAGITSVVDPALECDELLAYQAAAASRALTVRTTGMPLGDGRVDPELHAQTFTDAGVMLSDHTGDRWRVGPWKLFLDGGGSLGTALLDEPWPGSDGYFGNQTTSTEALIAYARWAAQTGVGLGAHAVGSAAIGLFLDACAEADTVRSIRDLGFTLIHAYLWPSAQQMARARDLGVLVATQAPLQWQFGAGLVRRFGEAAAGRAHPLRSWLELGVTVGGGSDGPGGANGAPVDPMWAFWQMRRRTIAGRDDPVGPEEAITADQALALYTTGAAQVARTPDRGRLSAGAVADLVAIDVDPLRASPEACKDGAVLVTILGGEIVHDAR